MAKSQQSWVWSHHPLTQWNLSGGRGSSVEYGTVHRKKAKKISLLSVGEKEGGSPTGKRLCVTWEERLVRTALAPQSTTVRVHTCIFTYRDEKGWVYLPSAHPPGAYSATLYVMVFYNRLKGGGRPHPPPPTTSQGCFFHHDGMYARNRQFPLCGWPS